MSRIQTTTIAALTALGIALTPVPAAAQSNENIGRIIAGIAIAGIVAKAIDSRKDRDRREVTRSNDRFPRFGTIEDRNDRVVRGDLRSWGERRQNQQRGYKKRPLPERCLRVLNTAGRDRGVYAARCLNRNFKFANRLPDACALRVRTDRGVRTVYGRRCLSRDGWQVTARR